MKATILLVSCFLITACTVLSDEHTVDEQGAKEISIQSIEEISSLQDCFYYFRDCRRNVYFSNNAMGFGQRASKYFAQNILQFDTEMSQGAESFIWPKHAFVIQHSHDSTYFFIYGVTRDSDSLLSEMRVRSFRNAQLVSDTTVFMVREGIDHDYYVHGVNRRAKGSDRIFYVIAKNKDEKEHVSLIFCSADGSYQDRTPIPDTVFSDRPKLFRVQKGKVRLFNDYETRTFTLPNGKQASLTGTATECIGGHGIPDQVLIILDENDLFKERFALLDFSSCVTYRHHYTPVRMKLCETGEIIGIDGPYGNTVPDVPGREYPEHLYFEPIVELKQAR